MNRKLLLSTCVAGATMALVACTGMYAGKAVSADGTILIGRTVDTAPWTACHRFVATPRIADQPGRVYAETPDGFTWRRAFVGVEPGAETAVPLFGVSASPLFTLRVKVRSADGLTLSDFAASEYADTPLELTLNGSPVVLGSDGTVSIAGLSVIMGDELRLSGTVRRAELDQRQHRLVRVAPDEFRIERRDAAGPQRTADLGQFRRRANHARAPIGTYSWRL